MKQIFILSAISFVAGSILLLLLWAVHWFTGNEAYVLLTNFDYIPGLNSFNSPVAGYLFHYITCLLSVFFLYYILKPLRWQKQYWPYIVVYSVGGGILFFLTALSPQPPSSADTMAWIYWTIAHAVFGLSVAFFIREWLPTVRIR